MTTRTVKTQGDFEAALADMVEHKKKNGGGIEVVGSVWNNVSSTIGATLSPRKGSTNQSSFISSQRTMVVGTTTMSSYSSNMTEGDYEGKVTRVTKPPIGPITTKGMIHQGLPSIPFSPTGVKKPQLSSQGDFEAALADLVAQKKKAPILPLPFFSPTAVKKQQLSSQGDFEAALADVVAQKKKSSLLSLPSSPTAVKKEQLSAQGDFEAALADLVAQKKNKPSVWSHVSSRLASLSNPGISTSTYPPSQPPPANDNNVVSVPISDPNGTDVSVVVANVSVNSSSSSSYCTAPIDDDDDSFCSTTASGNEVGHDWFDKTKRSIQRMMMVIRPWWGIGHGRRIHFPSWGRRRWKCV